MEGEWADDDHLFSASSRVSSIASSLASDKQIDSWSKYLDDDGNDDDDDDEEDVELCMTYIVNNIHTLFPDILQDGEEIVVEPRPAKKSRQRYDRPLDYWATPWGLLMMNNPKTESISTREGRMFRRRFRVPYKFFRDFLVPRCKEKNIFRQKKRKDGSLRNTVIPFEFKLLIGLRMLGRSNCADDITEMTGIGESTVNGIFKEFIFGFTKAFYDDFVYMPQGEDLARVMEVYRRLGFPGCVGSMDCTHIFWMKCPVELTNACSGKEKHPTLSFQVVVDHSRRIRHVAGPFFGAMNDKNICEHDPLIFPDRRAAAPEPSFLRDKVTRARGTLYKDEEFILLDQNGVPTLYKGGYLLTDGGYTDLTIFVNPNVNRNDRQNVLFGEFLESVRKDVECAFGLLKARFRFLAGHVQYHSMQTIGAAFKAACILHNMLLLLDGYDISAWDLGDPEAWNNVDAFGDGEGINDDEWDDYIATTSTRPAAAADATTSTDDTLYVDNDDDIVVVRREQVVPKEVSVFDLDSFRNALIINFSVRFKLGQIQWPKCMKDKDRTSCRMPPPVSRSDVAARRRAWAFVNEGLYSAPSVYLAYSSRRAPPADDEVGRRIGRGLFTHLFIRAGEKIAEFKGDIISLDQYEQRVVSGKGGYALRLNETTLLDCYEYAVQSNDCKASLANDPTNLRHHETNEVARANATVKVNHRTQCFWLVASEILWCYGADYFV